MRVGAPVRAHLLYPVYSGSTLVLPAQTTLVGSVVALRPDHARRVQARLNLDFTPFHTPVVRFASIEQTDGTLLPFAAGEAIDGAPVFRIIAPVTPPGTFLHRQFSLGKSAVKDRLRIITDPEKGDRFKQFLYHQMPYHPERIAKGTTWTVENTAPLDVTPASMQPSAPASDVKLIGEGDVAPAWMLQAYLSDPLTSATTKVGASIKATVAEPVFNPDGTLAVPQGATLFGTVTKSRPARLFSRPGALTFSFRQLVLPGAEPQSVQVALKGVDNSSGSALQMDSEGEVKPKARDKLIVPFILLSLAARPLDEDRGGRMFAKDAVASNSLGFIGFVVGTATRNAGVAAGIGYYGAALSIYSRVVSRGKEVAFPRDTRIVLQTTARRTAAMKPDDPQDRPR